MHPEAAFLTGYALALVALGAGLEALGRRSTDPWSSRVLAASRPPSVEQRDKSAPWLHSDVPAFHLGLSGVALTAALLLTAVSLIRHHDPIELVVQLAVLALVTTRIAGVVRRCVASAAQQRDRGPRS